MVNLNIIIRQINRDIGLMQKVVCKILFDNITLITTANYKFINAMKIPNPLIHYDLNGFSSQLTRLARLRVWSERGRAFSESSIRIDLKVFGIVISYSLCILKFIFPRLGSRTLNFLNNIR